MTNSKLEELKRASDLNYMEGSMDYYIAKLEEENEKLRIERDELDAAWSNCSRACARVQGERDAARAEIEQLKADAARYRWLRDVGDDPYKLMAMWYAVSPYDRTIGSGANSIDAAIDAAMKEKP